MRLKGAQAKYAINDISGRRKLGKYVFPLIVSTILYMLAT